MRSIKIRIKDKHIVSYLKNKIFTTQHFENMMIILINQDFNQNQGKNFNYLTNGRIMRAVFRNTSGGSLKAKVDYIKDFYKNNSLMKDIINTSQELKIHNIVQQINNIKKNYLSFFTKCKNNYANANKPHPHSLKFANHITLYMDGYKSITLKHNNLIGLNLHDKMIYTHVKHSPLLHIVKDFKNVKNINLNYSGTHIYMIINYLEQIPTYKNINPVKYAGLDLGIINRASIYIHDETSNSLLISGKNLISYNSNFNRLIYKINSTMKNLSLSNNYFQIYYLIKFKKFLYEKRYNYFYTQMNYISNKILKYLAKNNVTHLIVSKVLNNLKYNGNCNINKNIKNHFLQIPIIKLIDYISLKACNYNIKVILVDECYTSKTSSLSRDIFEIKSIANNSPLSTDDFG